MSTKLPLRVVVVRLVVVVLLVVVVVGFGVVVVGVVGILISVCDETKQKREKGKNLL